MPPIIHIRRYEPTDIDSLFEAVIESRAELSPWMPWCHAEYSRSDTTHWIESRSSAWASGSEWSFLIVDSEGRILGAGGFHRLDLRNGTAELGYWVRSSVTCRGIASEAVRRLTHWAFIEAGLHRIEILASVENIASHRVAEKSGAVLEGILRERLTLLGRRHDCKLFSIVKDRD